MAKQEAQPTRRNYSWPELVALAVLLIPVAALLGLCFKLGGWLVGTWRQTIHD